MQLFPCLARLFPAVFLTATLSAGEVLLPAKGTQNVIAPPVDPTTTVFGMGVKTNSNLTEGNAFLVQPLWDNVGQNGTMGGSIFFAEPYVSWAERGEIAGSLGLGFRHLFSDEPVDGSQNRVASLLGEGFFIGGNVFADFLRSIDDANIWQLGVGIEAGTRYLEFRANYYFPLDDDTVGQYQTTELRPGSSGGRPVVFATTRTIDIVEGAMEGWDAEVALLVPGIDRWCDVRLIGGYFDFESGASSRTLARTPDFGGWKAGVEIRPVPAVVLSGMWYEDELLVRDNWIVGVRLEIPLGKPESFTPRRRHLQERLIEPVRRQNAAIVVETSHEPRNDANTVALTSQAQFESHFKSLASGGNTVVVYAASAAAPGGSSYTPAALSSGFVAISGGWGGSGGPIGSSALVDMPNVTGGTLTLGGLATRYEFINGQYVPVINPTTVPGTTTPPPTTTTP